jgi:hypothetical protein
MGQILHGSAKTTHVVRAAIHLRLTNFFCLHCSDPLGGFARSYPERQGDHSMVKLTLRQFYEI